MVKNKTRKKKGVQPWEIAVAIAAAILAATGSIWIASQFDTQEPPAIWLENSAEDVADQSINPSAITPLGDLSLTDPDTKGDD